MRRLFLVTKAVTVAVFLVLGLTVAGAPNRPAAAAADRLPDLGMAHPTDLKLEKTSDGRRLLRFSSIVANVGAGAFEVLGERAPGSSTMSIRQRIFDDAGGSRYVLTTATAYFGGDGHNHWHVSDLEDFELTRLDNGRLVGTGAKHGFCFYDNYGYGSNSAAFYTSAGGACGRAPSDTAMTMGLSVRWADIYSSNLPDQYIDISGLTAGRYRLTSTADPSNWFTESNDQNNLSWIDIQLQGNSVKVTARGPSA